MIKQFGLNNTTIYRQPGFTVSRNQNGGWSARGTYEMTRAAWESKPVRDRFALRAPIEQIDPDVESFLRFLRVDSVDVISDVGDTVVVNVAFTGSSDLSFSVETGDANPKEEAEYTSRLEVRESEKSILTWPGFNALDQVEKDALSLQLKGELVWGNFNTEGLSGAAMWTVNPDSWSLGPQPYNLASGRFPVTSTLGIFLANRIAAGQITRTVHSVSYVYTTQGFDKITGKTLKDLDSIKEPPGDPPTPTGRDWKFVGATQEVRGALIQTTLEYEVSGEGGWDEPDEP